MVPRKQGVWSGCLKSLASVSDMRLYLSFWMTIGDLLELESGLVKRQNGGGSCAKRGKLAVDVATLFTRLHFSDGNQNVHGLVAGENGHGVR